MSMRTESRRTRDLGGAETTPMLHLSEAAAQLGIVGPDAARRLRRFLLARERKLGEQIMTRAGGEKQVRYRISMARLEQFCPEFFRQRVEMMELLDERLEALHADICELRDRDEAIASAVARIVTKSPARAAG